MHEKLEVLMRKTIERILGVTEKKMNKRFIARLSLFERIILSIFMYAWFAVEIAILAVVYCALWAWDGLKKLKVRIAAWFDRCVKKLARNGYIFSLSEYNMAKLRRGVLVAIASVLCISFLIAGIAIRNNIERETLEQGLANVTFEYVTAGSDEGEYYTWWSIAKTYCPSYMHVSNFGSVEDGNYLQLLYEYNGGNHVLRDGEQICVPILE